MLWVPEMMFTEPVFESLPVISTFLESMSRLAEPPSKPEIPTVPPRTSKPEIAPVWEPFSWPVTRPTRLALSKLQFSHSMPFSFAIMSSARLPAISVLPLR